MFVKAYTIERRFRTLRKIFKNKVSISIPLIIATPLTNILQITLQSTP